MNGIFKVWLSIFGSYTLFFSDRLEWIQKESVIKCVSLSNARSKLHEKLIPTKLGTFCRNCILVFLFSFISLAMRDIARLTDQEKYVCNPMPPSACIYRSRDALTD